MTDTEIVKLAAEKVMGAVGIYEWQTMRYAMPQTLFIHDEDSPYIEKIEGWNPLTSIADAFMLIAALQANGWQSVELRYFKPGKYSHPEDNETYWALYLGRDSGPFNAYASADTRERAIVLACLKACNVEVEEPTCKP